MTAQRPPKARRVTGHALRLNPFLGTFYCECKHKPTAKAPLLIKREAVIWYQQHVAAAVSDRQQKAK